MASDKNQDDLCRLLEKLREIKGDVTVQTVFVDEDPLAPEVPGDQDKALDSIIAALERKSKE
jgi:hypothetical protein